MAAEPSLTDGIIATRFGRDGDDLMIGGISASDLAREFGTPLYAYDAGLIRRAYRDLADALSGFARIHYSIKANPNVEIVRLLLAEGAGVEIASLGEYRAARQAGADPGDILFAGPGKRRHELEEVVRDGIGEIHLEFLEEIAALDAVAGQRERASRSPSASIRWLRCRAARCGWAASPRPSASTRRRPTLSSTASLPRPVST